MYQDVKKLAVETATASAAGHNGAPVIGENVLVGVERYRALGGWNVPNFDQPVRPGARNLRSKGHERGLEDAGGVSLEAPQARAVPNRPQTQRLVPGARAHDLIHCERRKKKRIEKGAKKKSVSEPILGESGLIIGKRALPGEKDTVHTPRVCPLKVFTGARAGTLQSFAVLS